MNLLRGKRVLILEDEPLIALALVDILTEAGCLVVGPAYDACGALKEISESPPDAAILDVNLGLDQSSAEVADALDNLGVPFFYATGYGEAALRKVDRGKIRVDKPYDREAVYAALLRCLADMTVPPEGTRS